MKKTCHLLEGLCPELSESLGGAWVSVKGQRDGSVTQPRLHNGHRWRRRDRPCRPAAGLLLGRLSRRRLPPQQKACQAKSMSSDNLSSTYSRQVITCDANCRQQMGQTQPTSSTCTRTHRRSRRVPECTCVPAVEGTVSAQASRPARR